MSFLRLLLIVVLCLLTCLTLKPPPSFTHAAQADDLAPYIQYYSHAYQGIVVERADGTDSRVIGRGLIPPEDNQVLGPGWSPSGEWFAFYSRVGGMEYWEYSHPFVINTRTDEVYPLPKLQYINEMKWLESRPDTLLIRNPNAGGYSGVPSETQIYLIDLVQRETIFYAALAGGAHAELSADGRYLTLTHTESRINDPVKMGYYLYDLKLEKILTERNGDGAFVLTWSPEQTYLLVQNKQWSADDLPPKDSLQILDKNGQGMYSIDGWGKWLADDKLMIVDNATHTWTDLNLSNQMIQTRPMPAEKFTAIDVLEGGYLGTTFSENTHTYSYWLYDGQQWQALDTATAHFELFVSPRTGLQFRLFWQSPSNRLRKLYILKGASLELVNEKAYNLKWSPDGRYFAYETGLANELWLYDTQTYTQTLIATQPQANSFTFTPDPTYLFFRRDGSYTFRNLLTHEVFNIPIPDFMNVEADDSWASLTWVGEDILNVNRYDQRFKGEAFEIDLRTATIRQLNYVQGTYRIAPDQIHAFYSGKCTQRPYNLPRTEQLCLENRDTGSQIALNQLFNLDGVVADWHNSSAWVILSEYYAYHLYYSIVDASGNYYRRLIDDCTREACLGWVPSRIHVDELMSPPDSALDSTGMLLYVPGMVKLGAWSPEGRYLAVAYTQSYFTTEHAFWNGVIVWDMVTLQPLQNLPTPLREVVGMRWTQDNELILVTDIPHTLIDNSWHPQQYVLFWRLGEASPYHQITEIQYDTLVKQPYGFVVTSAEPYYFGQVFFIQANVVIAIKIDGLITSSGEEIIALTRNLALKRYNLILNTVQEIQLERSIWESKFMGDARIAVDPQGYWFAVGETLGKMTYLWHLGSHRVEKQFYGGGALAFSPDGSQLAIGDAQSVRIFNITP